MNYQQLLEMQEQLDRHIMKKQKLQFIKLSNLVLALSTEISEVANAYQKWKYWKVNNQPKEDLLEEIADFTHFLLSLSNRFYVDNETISKLIPVKYNEVEIHFLQMQYTASMIGVFGDAEDKQLYVQIMWKLFKGLLEHLGFTENDVFQVYLKKNKINYERQASNY